MRTLPILLLLCSLAPPSARAEADAETFSSRPHGLQLRRPGPGWRWAQQPATDGGLTVALTRDKATRFVVQLARATPGETAPALADLMRKRIAGQPKYRDVRAARRTVDGRSGCGLRVDVTSGGVALRIEQVYVVHRGWRATLAVTAPAAHFAALAPTFARVWSSVRLRPPVPTAADRRAAALKALAARCGRELPWAASWSEAVRRARAERKLILVCARFMKGFAISDILLSGPFADPDVKALLRSRYVLFRLGFGVASPLSDRRHYGLGPAALGQALLLVTPDARVLHDQSVLGTAAVTQLLLTGIARYPEHDGAPGLPPAAPLARAAWLLDRGELALAAKLLEAPATAAGHRLQARLYRLRRDLPRAAAALTKAAAAAGADATAIAVDRAALLIRGGRVDEAERLLTSQRRGARAAEALYQLGACRLARKDVAGATRHWAQLVERHATSPWAARAAAWWTSSHFERGVGPPLIWPDEAVLRALVDPPARAERPVPGDRTALAVDARRYLLERQRPDGSWVAAAEERALRPGLPNAFTLAVTAIAAQALLPAAARAPRAREAVTRALAYLEGSRAVWRAAERANQTYFDYWVWTDSVALALLVRAGKAGLGQPGHPALMRGLVESLMRRQLPSGGWSYYLSHAAGGARSQATISFVSAAVLLALQEAAAAGVNVPPPVIRKGLDQLARMRRPSGLFDYMSGSQAQASIGNSCRGPVCELALFAAGRSDVTRLRRAITLFTADVDALAGEAGKSVMHAGPGNLGAHYVLWDLAQAARVVARSGGAGQARLLKTIAALRASDGSYLDQPLIGRHFGTAIILEALEQLGG